MTAGEIAFEVAERLFIALIDVLGPALIRKRVDEWELARVPSEVAFEQKFGEKL